MQISVILFFVGLIVGIFIAWIFEDKRINKLTIENRKISSDNNKITEDNIKLKELNNKLKDNKESMEKLIFKLKS